MTPADHRLEFLGALGKGGFGSIYLANLRGTDGFVRRVAVKVLRYAGTEDAALVARQRDEARLLGLLSHESIVQVIDQASVLGRPAVIMEYVEGVDLHELSRSLRVRKVAFSPRAAFEVIAAVAGALDVAWSSLSPLTGQPLRVVHRDIKPGNIIVTVRGGVKVLDFGIARAEFDRDGVSRSIAFGTPSYMAPEFWQQEPIGDAYDVYALGVTLLELLSGHVPDRAPMEAARSERFFEDRLALLQIPTAAADLLRDMVAFDVARRCSAARVQERALELLPLLSGAPLSREARAWVPELLEVRAQAISAGEVPTLEALGLGGVVDYGGARGAVASGAVVEPDAATLALRSRWYWAAGAGLAGAVGVGVLATVALLVAAGIALSDVLSGVSSGVSPDVLSGASPDVSPDVSPDALQDVLSGASPDASPDVSRVQGGPVAATIGSSNPTEQPTPAGPGSLAPKVKVADSRVSAGPSATDVGLTTTPRADRALAPPTIPQRTLSFGANVVGAALVVDGESQGKTPSRGVSLGDGAHWIVARLGDRSCSQHILVGPHQPSGYVCDFDTEKWTSKI